MSQLLPPSQRRFFLEEFRFARAQVLEDTENFSAVIHAIERLGSFLYPTGGGLASYQAKILELCKNSAVFQSMRCWMGRDYETLYNTVKEARNETMHVGATARHAASNALLLSLLVEDALTGDSSAMQNYMVSDPVCAERWQPIGMIRQKMLTNSFSFLPVRPDADVKSWQLISDLQLARFLRDGSSSKRRSRLATTLEAAIADKGVVLEPVTCCLVDEKIENLLSQLEQKPILLFADKEKTRLAGLVTPFDLL